MLPVPRPSPARAARRAPDVPTVTTRGSHAQIYRPRRTGHAGAAHGAALGARDPAGRGHRALPRRRVRVGSGRTRRHPHRRARLRPRRRLDGRRLVARRGPAARAGPPADRRAGGGGPAADHRRGARLGRGHLAVHAVLRPGHRRRVAAAAHRRRAADGGAGGRALRRRDPLAAPDGHHARARAADERLPHRRRRRRVRGRSPAPGRCGRRAAGRGTGAGARRGRRHPAQHPQRHRHRRRPGAAALRQPGRRVAAAARPSGAPGPPGPRRHRTLGPRAGRRPLSRGRTRRADDPGRGDHPRGWPVGADRGHDDDLRRHRWRHRGPRHGHGHLLRHHPKPCARSASRRSPS